MHNLVTWTPRIAIPIWFRVLVALGVLGPLAAACGGEPVDDGFAEGREMAPVYLVIQDDLGEDDQLRASLDEAYRWLYDAIEPDMDFAEFRTGGFSNRDTPQINLELRDVRFWSYSVPQRRADPYCDECTPLEMSDEEMIAIATDLWDRLGIEYSQPYFQPFSEPPVTHGAVLANERRDGVLTSLEWSVRFGGGVLGIRQATGYWGTSLLKVGEVPLLTVAEAYQQRGLPYLETNPDTVELGTRLSFDRSNGNFWQIPAWWIQPEALHAPISLDAYRPQDLTNLDVPDNCFTREPTECPTQ